MSDFQSLDIKLIDDATIETIKRLLAGIDVDDCRPFVRVEGEMPTERVPVFHHGERVGTVPAEFDPAFIKSKSSFYTPRPGDFTRTAEGWVVDKMMGPGDVAAVPGFQAEVLTHREHW